MPSRKSDQRKSDVTAARFALAEDDVDYPSSHAVDVEPANAASSKKRQSLTTGQTKKAKQKETGVERVGTGDLEKGKDEDDEAEQDKDKDGEKEKDKDKDKDAKDAITVEDLTLPKSIITRLAKGVLPPNTQIQANAILALSKSTVVFINYLAAHANEHTMNAGKKTIAPADVFKALDDIEFPFLKDRLEAEFAKFNSIQTAKRSSYRQKVRAAKQSPDDNAQTADTDMADADVDSDAAAVVPATASTASKTDRSGAPPKAKKARVDTAIRKNGGVGAEAGDGEDTEMDEEQDAEDEDDAEEDDEEEEDEEVEDEEEEVEVVGDSGEETQDALEASGDDGGEEEDEALDRDDSD